MNYNFNYISNLLKDFYFPDFFCENTFYELNDSSIFEKDFKIFTGSSKLVIVPPFTDYVIKIPFNCYEDLDENFNTTYIDFIGAFNDPKALDCWDYCAKEVYIYSLSKNYFFNTINPFPETIFFDTINHWPIYLQEKCKSFKSLSFHSSFSNDELVSTYCTLKKECGSCCSVHSEWLTSYYKRYGLAETSSLLKFLQYYHLDDFHGDNVGFSNKDNRLVLIDFSGYNE